VNAYYIKFSVTLRTIHRKILRTMVSTAGFEPATHALKGLTAREMNNLHGTLRSVMKCYKSCVQKGFSATPYIP
jgi:hypothetical protein